MYQCRFAALVALQLFVLSHPVPAHGGRHAFSWEDMFAMARLSDPQPSPDGASILYVHNTFDVPENTRNLELAVVTVEGTGIRQLTKHPAADFNGRWLPDGSAVVFLSDRSGSTQLWQLPARGGEPVQVSHLPIDINGFELSPDGKHVLFWADIFPNCAGLGCTAARLQARQKSQVKAMVFESLFIRHWDRWSDGRRQHLFVMSFSNLKPRDLMPGMVQDAPTLPWGDAREVAWSPDSKTVAFTSKPSAGEAWKTNSQIYMAPVKAPAGTKPRCITSENEALDTTPAFSPDGKKLAYLAMERPGYESDRLHVVLMDLRTKRKQHFKSWDRSVSELLWANDSKTLYLVAQEEARNRIFTLDTTTGAVKTLVRAGRNTKMALTRGGGLVHLQDRMVHPAEVFLTDPRTGATRQISQVNADKLAQTAMSEPEEFYFDHDGWRIHGWLLKPVGFREGQKYPLAFLVHGGPQGAWLDSFHYRWNSQFYAGAGYVTVGINFRGSTGFGQAFTDAIRTDWGTGPFEDLMAGLDHVLREHPYVDKTRMCALGASYGGHMVNWIAGQEHPFVCLVNHDGGFATTGFYFHTEELWFPEWEMNGTPWENPETYRRNSPAQFVARWKTPMLVIQGALDFRVVETEGFSTFNTLQRLGVPSKLLYFPDENHWVLKPLNSQLWHKTVREWLDIWTRTPRASGGP